MPNKKICNFRLDWNNEQNRPLTVEDIKKGNGCVDHSHLCSLKINRENYNGYCDDDECILYRTYYMLTRSTGRLKWQYELLDIE